MNYKMFRHFYIDIMVPYMYIIGLCYGIYYIVTNPDKVFPLSPNINHILILYVSIIMFSTRLFMFYLDVRKSKNVDSNVKGTTKVDD